MVAIKFFDITNNIKNVIAFSEIGKGLKGRSSFFLFNDFATTIDQKII